MKAKETVSERRKGRRTARSNVSTENRDEKLTLSDLNTSRGINVTSQEREDVVL